MVSSSHPLSVMRVFDIASHQFYGFFRTQKILKSEELLPSFTFLNKNIEKKEKKKVHPFFTSFLDNLKSLKVIFAWLTLMSALFPYGKILCPWCFSSHQLSLMEKLCTRFSCLGKTIHVCLSYSTPSVMRVFGMASQFYGFFRTQKIQKSEELMCSGTASLALSIRRQTSTA